MSDLQVEGDSALPVADSTSDSDKPPPDSDLPVRVPSILKGGAYRISRQIIRGGNYYLTRNGMDVEPSLLNVKSNAQIWSVKAHLDIAGLYTIASLEDPDLHLTYDTSMNIVVDGYIQIWNLDIRGSQFVIGDFVNDKAINLDKNTALEMRPRSDSVNFSDHSQRWTFTHVKDVDPGSPDDDDPPGLQDWRGTTLQSGLYFVMNPVNTWFQWIQSTLEKGSLTTYPLAQSLPKTNYNNFVAAAFVFSRNEDGSYYITNWNSSGQAPHEHFLQLSNGGPVLADLRSKCHLYYHKESDSYVIAISETDKPGASSHLRDVIFDPPTANSQEKKMETKKLRDVSSSSGGVLWKISKIPP
jgi:hypothetical protein